MHNCEQKIFMKQLLEYEYTGWNDKIVAQEKTWFHFRLMKTGFLFFFFLLQTVY